MRSSFNGKTKLFTVKLTLTYIALSSDETRDDLKQMKSEIQNISEKLNSQMLQREETMDEGKD